MIDISYILGSTSFERFKKQFFGLKHLYIQGDPERYANYFNWKDLNEYLSTHKLQPPRLRLEQFGKDIAELDSFIDTFRTRRGNDIPVLKSDVLYKLLGGGATLVLDAVNEFNENVFNTCEDLQRKFYVKPQVNLYASWRDVEGFGIHWDDHDVFVIQLYGNKKWEIYGETRKFPLFRDTRAPEKPETAPIDTVMLSPGDALYIPRGHWHNVVGLGLPTLHLTIGLNIPTGLDFLDWAVDNTRDNLIARSNAPIFSGKTENKVFLDELKDSILNQLSMRKYESFLQSRFSSLPGKNKVSLPYGVAGFDEITDDMIFSFSGVTYTKEYTNNNKSILIKTCGKEYKFSIKSEAILLDIIKHPTCYHDLIKKHENQLTRKEINTFLQNLLNLNFLWIVE